MIQCQLQLQLGSGSWESPGPGPVETRLHQYGRVEGLTFGTHGEGSKDLLKIIDRMTERGHVCCVYTKPYHVYTLCRHSYCYHNENLQLKILYPCIGFWGICWGILQNIR